MTRNIGAFLTGILILAGLFVMVRPGSKGPSLVSGVSNGLKGLITASTGGGTWAKG